MLDSIREMLDREPFVPFRIVLTSGKEYEILNSHLVALGETQLTLYAPRSDKWAMLRLKEIASVQSSQAA